jgi:predicted ferric reductase
LQIARYVSDRAGFLAIAQLPMIWLFATRNDPFLWLTGWTFATYNRFHRWIARIATVQAIIHSIGYTVYSFYYMPDGSNYRESWTEEYWYCGGIVSQFQSWAGR